MLVYSNTAQRLGVSWCHFYKIQPSNFTITLKQEAPKLFVSPGAMWPRIQCTSTVCSRIDKASWKEDGKDVSKGLLKYCWVYGPSRFLKPGEQKRKIPVSLTMRPPRGASSVGKAHYLRRGASWASRGNHRYQGWAFNIWSSIHTIDQDLSKQRPSGSVMTQPRKSNHTYSKE